MTSITIPYGQRTQAALQSPLAIPDDGLLINGHHFSYHILQNAFKNNKLLFGTCHCGNNNAPLSRHGVFVCARCRRAEAVYAETHKSKQRRHLTASQQEADRIKRQRRAALQKYAENIYVVRGLRSFSL